MVETRDVLHTGKFRAAVACECTQAYLLLTSTNADILVNSFATDKDKRTISNVFVTEIHLNYFQVKSSYFEPTKLLEVNVLGQHVLLLLQTYSNSESFNALLARQAAVILQFMVSSLVSTIQS